MNFFKNTVTLLILFLVQFALIKSLLYYFYLFDILLQVAETKPLAEKRNNVQ